jgi:hypothetical protein
MKRVLLSITIAALVAVMLVASAPAAFAHDQTCTGKGWYPNFSWGHPADADGDGAYCSSFRKGTTYYKDDHGYRGH